MSLKFAQGNITKFKVDAIVNAANSSLLGGGGVDGAIHRAAGAELLEECRKLRGCKTGEAKITGGYNLSAKYVIHTVGPVYLDGKHGEEDLLRLCYKSALGLVKRHDIKSIAFPLISTGRYNYPIDEAITIAVTECREFIKNTEIDILIILFGNTALESAIWLYPEIERGE